MWVLAVQTVNPGCEWSVWAGVQHLLCASALAVVPHGRGKTQNEAYALESVFEFCKSDE